MTTKHKYLKEDDIRELLKSLPKEVDDTDRLFDAIQYHLEHTDYLSTIDKVDTLDEIHCVDIFKTKRYSELQQKKLKFKNQIRNNNKYFSK